MNDTWCEWQDEILSEQKDSIIESLASERVLHVSKTERGIKFVELCDEYYGCTLSREQCMRFIAELQALLDDDDAGDQAPDSLTANSD
ncbi:MAG: hypothetical protein R3C04_08675 [Hyphomonas sp.]